MYKIFIFFGLGDTTKNIITPLNLKVLRRMRNNIM